MEMLMQPPQRAAGISGGGCRPGVRATAPAMAIMSPAASTAKREREDVIVSKDAEAEAEAEAAELRRGPWTVDEDLTLINYIAEHGEGRWNALARAAGLKRTGKSCRLRWLNYLRPDVKRGDFTADEQLLILDLHSRWGNRWSKIAAQLPGRTDNEIKNYWRTRVQKHAKQLNCDVNSARFKDAMRFLWMPRLAERAAAQQQHQHQQPAPAPADVYSSLTTAAMPPEEVAMTTMAMAMAMTNAENDEDDHRRRRRSSPCSAVTTATTTTTTSSSCSASSHASSESTTARDDDGNRAAAAAAAVPVGAAGGDDEWAAAAAVQQQQQDQDQDQEFWSTASALQHLTTGADHHHHHQQLFQFHDLPPLQDLTGWVQGFSEVVGVSPAETTTTTTTQLWSLDDIWRMQ